MKAVPGPVKLGDGQHCKQGKPHRGSTTIKAKASLTSENHHFIFGNTHDAKNTARTLSATTSLRELAAERIVFTKKSPVETPAS